MHLTDTEIQEFQALWSEEFNEVIPFEDARIRALELLELYALLARAPWVEENVSS